MACRLKGRLPRIDWTPYDGRIPKEHRPRREVSLLLGNHDFVIALTDVHTGSLDFKDGADARQKMRQWVGDDGRFFPHAAQHDFEAWLLPYWDRVKRISGYDGPAPSAHPERVDHQKPPARHVAEAFRVGGKRKYSKVRDAAKILEGADLEVAAAQCPELKMLLETILHCSGSENRQG